MSFVVFVSSACASIQDSIHGSIKNWPGFRKNVEQEQQTVKLNPFQRSAAVQSTGYESLGLHDSPLSLSAKPQRASFQAADSSAVSRSGKRNQPGRDVELILGNHQYYRNGVERPGIIGGGGGPV